MSEGCAAASSAALPGLLMAPGGRLLLAGLLSDQVEEVVAAYAPAVNLRVVDQLEDWVLLAGQRTG